MTKISKIILSISSIVLLVSGLLVTTAYATESLPNVHENQEFHEEALFGPVLEGENYIIIDDNPLSRMAGRWQQRGTFWYFYPSGGGARLANTWMQDPAGNWYWFDLNGRMATGWRTISGRRFFFNPRSGLVNHRTGIGGEGVMHTGWSEIDRHWFFFNPAQGRPGHRTGIGGEGALHIGWSRIPITRTSNTLDWFFFQPAGQMTTGWRNIPINNSGGRLSYHYFHSSGRWHVNAFARPMRNGRVSSSIGPRLGLFHAGTDMYSSVNYLEPILAAAPGRVITSEWNNSLGWYVVLLHNINGTYYITMYAHLRYQGTRVGTNVVAGNQIGIQGNTGNSHGAHLHFEIHRATTFLWDNRDGASLDRGILIDPERRIDLRGTWSNTRMLPVVDNEDTYIDEFYTNHPVVGTWKLTDSILYGHDNERVDLLLLWSETMDISEQKLPFTLHSNGRITSIYGQQRWSISEENGRLFLPGDLSYYSLEENTLILSSYLPDGSNLRRTFIRVH